MKKMSKKVRIRYKSIFSKGSIFLFRPQLRSSNSMRDDPGSFHTKNDTNL